MLKKISKHYRIVAFLLSLLMVVSLFAGCSSTSATKETETKGTQQEIDGKVYEFSLSHFFPANHEIEVDVAKPWAEALFQASDGRIKINTYPGETLTKAAETYEGVVQGVTDIGISVYAYTRGRFPVLETLLLPGVSFYNSEASSWAAMEAIETMDLEELQDVHHVWTWGSGPADLFGKKPVRSLNDIKGLQIGATAGPRADGLQELGATPVILPMSEWYEALSRGVMDGGLAPLESMKGFRLGEVTADYITLTPFLYNQLFFNVMNKDAWDSLPADLQEIFTETTKEFYAEVMPTLWNRINEGGYNYVKELKEVEVIRLSDEETEKWMSYLPPVQAAYVEFLNERGFPGEEILKQMKDLADKYNGLYPEFAPYIK